MSETDRSYWSNRVRASPLRRRHWPMRDGAEVGADPGGQFLCRASVDIVPAGLARLRMRWSP